MRGLGPEPPPREQAASFAGKLERVLSTEEAQEALDRPDSYDAAYQKSTGWK